MRLIGDSFDYDELSGLGERDGATACELCWGL